jgi:hypothetical protein
VKIPFQPVVSDPAELHADWLELYALTVADGSSSYEDLVGVLRRNGSVDGVDDRAVPDRGSEITQSVADAAFAELDTRARACGDGYPFSITDQSISVRSDVKSSPYLFCLLLSHAGVKAGPRNIKAATHFEELCARAAEEYLGGDAVGVGSYHFGFPRRIGPSGFADALDELCARLGEGSGTKQHPRLRHQKDAKLDVVAWRAFPDTRRGKLVAFGQCAAGDEFDIKATELVSRRFTVMWMKDPLLLDPLRFFFVPRCLEDYEWEATTLADVILFDRCRITSMLEHRPLPSDLAKRTTNWCQFVLRQDGKAA